MDVAFVSNVVFPYVTGGAEKRIYEIGHRLVNKGHDVTVYGRHFWDGPEETTHEGMTLRAVAPEVELYQGDRRSITEAIDFAARVLWPLRRRLHRDEHDIVVASVFPYFPVLSTHLARAGTDTPLVTTWHEVWGEYWEEYLGTLAPCGKLVEYATARTPQCPIAVSGTTADRLAKIGLERSDIDVVPNGIDIDQVQSAPLPKQGYDILFVGRLAEHKNVDMLVAAFDHIATSYDVTLGIIGDGPERKRLEALCDGLTHADRIDFLGFLDEYEAVLGQMRAADVFCSPSTREGFGITFVEAMAANCTVVAADHPESAAAEVIGDSGFYADTTTDSLVTVLERALDGERPATNPLDRAQRYDWATVTEQAEAVYQRALTSSRA